ncbi:hypothetical protein Q1695_012953 [Nippostrongylus brasiliensis]|nr:hypothetical protein Q1695_012953 [Nippostrongylus brasiliensis]
MEDPVWSRCGNNTAHNMRGNVAVRGGVLVLRMNITAEFELMRIISSQQLSASGSAWGPIPTGRPPNPRLTQLIESKVRRQSNGT